jgi:AcrR family transcriptional regulator
LITGVQATPGARTRRPASAAAKPRSPGRPAGDLHTRERILELAVGSFAERGFAGTSVREIAGAAGITNASLLHHYRGKGALYGAVLERIADSLAVWSEPPPGGSAEDRALATVLGYVEWSREHAQYARIILRELLDNHDRAASARRWYLAPVMRRAVERLELAQAEGELGSFDAAMFMAQQIGAVAYFFAAEPTIRRILGEDGRSDLVGRFRAALGDNLRATLRAYAPRRAARRTPS